MESTHDEGKRAIVEAAIYLYAASPDDGLVRIFAERLRAHGSEEMSNEVMSYAEKLLLEGEKRGREEGLEVGRQEGREEVLEKLVAGGFDRAELERALADDSTSANA